MGSMTKFSPRRTKDVRYYVNEHAPILTAWGAEWVRNLKVPCSKLGWCPYGELGYAFPWDDGSALNLGMSDFASPTKCEKTGCHCPVYYLAPKDPKVAADLDCWDWDKTPNCKDCWKAVYDECPRGEAWARRVILEAQKDEAVRREQGGGGDRDE